MTGTALLHAAIADSTICRAFRMIHRVTRETRERVIVGLGGRWSPERARHEEQRLDAMLGDSRLFAMLYKALTAPATAVSQARATHALESVRAVDLQTRVQLVGCALGMAVVTHTAILAIVGNSVGTLGWTLRGILAVMAAWIAMYPHPFAAAWRHRSRQDARQPSQAGK